MDSPPVKESPIEGLPVKVFPVRPPLGRGVEVGRPSVKLAPVKGVEEKLAPFKGVELKLAPVKGVELKLAPVKGVELKLAPEVRPLLKGVVLGQSSRAGLRPAPPPWGVLGIFLWVPPCECLEELTRD